MSTRIKDLKPSTQPIARRLADSGFSMVDLINAGFVLLKDKTLDDISRLIRIANEIESESLPDVEAQFRKKVLAIVKEAQAIPVGKKSARRAKRPKAG